MDKLKLVMGTCFIEAIMLGIAFIWAKFVNLNILAQITFKDFQTIFIALALLTIINVLCVLILPKYVKFFRPLKDAYEELLKVVYYVPVYMALPMGLLSGFSEEVLFRGVIQEVFGIYIAALFFGLMHLGNKVTAAYAIYTIFVGLFFGYTYIYSGNLFVPIAIHVINNVCALPFMHYYYKYKILKKSGDHLSSPS